MLSAEHLLKVQNTAVIVVDAGLCLDYMNPAAEALLKVSRERGKGRPIVEILGSEVAIDPILEKAVESAENYTLRELTIVPIQSGEQMLVDCTVSPLQVNEQNGLLLELWRVDNLVKLARDSWRSEHQRATQQMIRGLAHEIKNPLGGLRGAAQLLERQLELDELKEYTGIITHEADRLSNLVDRMTAPYREIKREWLNPHELLEHVYRLVEVEEQGRVSLTRDYDPSLPEIHAERDGLTQVMLNIVRNAAQAIPDLGNITLRTRIGRQHSVGGRVYRQVIRIEIEDDGPGVSDEIAERLFFPMVTGRAEGTGLGLSIAQEIVTRHGGTIEFNSEPGHTCFLVVLPVTNEPV